MTEAEVPVVPEVGYKRRQSLVPKMDYQRRQSLVPGGVPNPGDVLDPMEMSKQLKAKHLWS